MNSSKALIIIIFICSAIESLSQRMDTVKIDASQVNTNVLRSGVHRYLVYFKNGKDSSRINYQMWSRKIDFVDYKGNHAISVTQEWEDNQGIMHKVNSICDKKTFSPLFHESWWKKRGSSVFDFVERTGSINKEPLNDSDTLKRRANAYGAFKKAWGQYVLNWHLDLEVFPILPYRSNVTFLINFYDPGFTEPKYQAYTVVGSGTLTGYNDQKIDCWLLSHNSQNNKEVFWISKKTKEVLKLEQEFAGRYRYKIKLGYSL